ncbi:head decoration protein [Paenibacillus sp. 481]|uniref:head decoration protein n=1 Tax=Paenibacillus sp. 481 TaxID=2835869 RepID=UPI001E498F68|nr:head decoration protein [Paenibacillus sp. 481]UHA74470.1 head decoration protein [Paenibacillus sp. 481]
MIQKNELQYKQLVVGEYPIVEDGITLKMGRAYKRGSVLGIITLENKATLVDSIKTDGSQTAVAILADDVDATLADKVALIYLTGEFNRDELLFGGTDTADKHKQALRNIGIFIKRVGK